MSGWLTRSKVMEARGYTAGQIKGRIQRGHWRKGVEFVDCDGARLFNLEAIDARADEMALTQRQAEPAQRRRPRLVAGSSPLDRLK